MPTTTHQDCNEIAANMHFTQIGQRWIADYKGYMIVHINATQFYVLDEWEQILNSSSLPHIVNVINSIVARKAEVAA